MSTDLHMLSGAFALNALSAEEAQDFRRHLSECTACRQEVRELQQAAARMGADVSVAPPEHLRARILAAADRTPQLPPLTRTEPTRAEPTRTQSIPIRGAQRWRRWSLVAAAAAAAVVTGVIGVNTLGDDASDDTRLAAGVVRVFEAEDAHTAEMPTENGGRIRVAASPELAQMAVDTDELPPLDDGQVYQLWAIHDGQMDSVGVLEPDEGAFMEMPEPDTEVAITVEPVGGSLQPTTKPIMRVNPSQI